jgi:hypothetical protein
MYIDQKLLDCRVATLHSTVGSHIYTHIPKPLTLTPNVSPKGPLTLAFTFRVHFSIYIKLSGLFDPTVPKKTRQFYSDPTSAVLNSPKHDSVVNIKLLLYTYMYIYISDNAALHGTSLHLSVTAQPIDCLAFWCWAISIEMARRVHWRRVSRMTLSEENIFYQASL